MKIKLLTLITFIIFLMFTSLSVGTQHLSYSFWLNLSELTDVQKTILFDLRIPRSLSLLFIGASLGLAGSLLQILFRNPLAEPYTLGVSGGASFGTMLSLLFGFTPVWLTTPLSSFLGASLAVFTVLYLFKRSDRRSLILAGVMTSLFFASLITLMMSLLDPHQLQGLMYWLIGQVGTERDQWWWLAALAFSFSVIWAQYRIKALDLLLLDEDLSSSLGVSLQKMQVEVVLVSSILSAISVSIAGLIGFVGLIAPHLATSYFKVLRAKTQPINSALMGAMILLTSDIIGRIIGREVEIPAGGLVALVGAPTLIYLLSKDNQYAKS